MVISGIKEVSMAKAKKKKTRLQKGFDVYQRWYKEYSSRNMMKDKKLKFRDYKTAYYNAKASGASMTNFSRELASRQKEASEIQVLTTWGIVKDNIKYLKAAEKLNQLTDTEREVLNKYEEITLKEYRLKIKDVLAAMESTVDRSDWEAQFLLAFKSPTESAVRRKEYNARRGSKKKKVAPARSIPA